MTYEERRNQVEGIRLAIENAVDDLGAYFTDSICGEDENGKWIVGFGVSGSTNIVVTPEFVEFGDAKSEPFSEGAKAALAELRQTIANC